VRRVRSVGRSLSACGVGVSSNNRPLLPHLTTGVVVHGEGDVRDGAVSVRRAADPARAWCHSRRLTQRHCLLHHAAMATARLRTGNLSSTRTAQVGCHRRELIESYLLYSC